MNSLPQNESIDARERVRRSFDKIKIINPFDNDYATVWDGFHHVVKAHSFAIMDRYIAEKWLTEQCKRIITTKADMAIKNENQRRLNSNQLPMDKTRKTGEQYEFETPFYADWTTQFPAIVREFGLYGGVVEEFGMTYAPQPVTKSNAIVTSILDNMEKPTEGIAEYEGPKHSGTTIGYEKKQIDSLTVEDLRGLSVFELRKVAKHRGLPFHMKSTKVELLTMLEKGIH